MMKQVNTMESKDQFPTNQLIRNTISAFRNGYIGEGQALSAIDFAAKLGDADAQALFDKCRETGVAEAFNSIGR